MWGPSQRDGTRGRGNDCWDQSREVGSRSPAESNGFYWACLKLSLLFITLIPQERELLNPKNWCIELIFEFWPTETCLQFFPLLFSSLALTFLANRSGL